MHSIFCTGNHLRRHHRRDGVAEEFEQKRKEFDKKRKADREAGEKETDEDQMENGSVKGNSLKWRAATKVNRR